MALKLADVRGNLRVLTLEVGKPSMALRGLGHSLLLHFVEISGKIRNALSVTACLGLPTPISRGGPVHHG